MRLTKILYSILCDDIRREDNGKYIYVGVYGSSLYPSKFPASLRLAIALSIEVDEAGEMSFSIETKLDGRRNNHGQGVFGTDEAGPLILPVKPVVLRDLPGPGLLSWSFQFGEDRFEDALTIPVVERPNDSAPLS